MERRRERYMIINAWQHIEDQGKKLMGFEMNERARHRTIKNSQVKWSKKSKNSMIIDNSPGRKLMRLFNAIPGEIRDITGLKTEAFLKRELDRWLNRVPDKPEIDEYRTWTNSNSIVHQVSQAERVEEWKNISGDPSKGSLAHQCY